MATLKISEISWPVVQPAFERALHKRVIGRKEIGIYDLAQIVGVHTKTVEGWLYAGTEPKAMAMHKLGLYFGPQFLEEVFGGIDAVEAQASVALSISDVVAIRDAASALADKLGAAVNGKGAQVLQFKEGA